MSFSINTFIGTTLTKTSIKMFTNFVSGVTISSGNIRLIEAFVICDGLIQAGKFIVEYIYYKIKDNVFVKRSDYIENSEILRKNLIREYNRLYELDVLDRYVFYAGLYVLYTFTSSLTQNLLDINTDVSYYMYLVCVLPSFQRFIINRMGTRYTKYKRNKGVFVHYTLCKTIINGVGDLDTSIHKIQNYHIFILYKYLTWDLAFNFMKTYGFIYLLYFLKQSEATYYYYKAIKLAYYYSTGYLFNAISQDDSVYIVNVVVRERRWFDIDKIEIVHAFYRLLNNRYTSERDTFTTVQLYFIKFCTLWSVVFSLKLFSAHAMSLAFIVYLIVAEIVNPLCGTARLKRYITSLVVYSMIVFHINDLIISSIFVLHPVVYYIVEEMMFFMRNSDDIHKILDFYNRSDKKVLRTRAQRIPASELSDKEYVLVTRT